MKKPIFDERLETYVKEKYYSYLDNIRNGYILYESSARALATGYHMYKLPISALNEALAIGISKHISGLSVGNSQRFPEYKLGKGYQQDKGLKNHNGNVVELLPKRWEEVAKKRQKEEAKKRQKEMILSILQKCVHKEFVEEISRESGQKAYWDWKNFSTEEKAVENSNMPIINAAVPLKINDTVAGYYTIYYDPLYSVISSESYLVNKEYEKANFDFLGRELTKDEIKESRVLSFLYDTLRDSHRVYSHQSKRKKKKL